MSETYRRSIVRPSSASQDEPHVHARRGHLPAIATAVGDLASFVAGVWLFWDGPSTDLRDLAVLGVPVFFLVYNASGMYRPNGQGARASLARSAAAGFLAAFLIWLIAVVIGTGASGASRDLPLFMGAVFAATWRVAVRRVERSIEGRQRWLIITHDGPESDEEVHLRRKISMHQDLSVEQIVSTTSAIDDSNLEQLLESVDAVVLSPKLDSDSANRLTVIALMHNKAMLAIPDLQGLLLHAGNTQRVDDLLVVAVARFQILPAVGILKRASDVAISIVALIALSPLLTVIAIVLRRDSPGPILFRQQRVGLRGATFEVIKFRTMIENAEDETGPVLATVDDPRITRVGKHLRRLRLDEFPQLLNVLRGEMTLVGPRPERPELIAELRESIPGYDLRHQIKPGVTGLAQVSTKYSTTAQDKLRFDLLYAQRYSLTTDLRILVQTLKVVLTSTSQAEGVASDE